MTTDVEDDSPTTIFKSLFRILSPSQKRLVFRHFSPFFSFVAPAMRLQKCKNWQKISLFLPSARESWTSSYTLRRKVTLGHYPTERKFEFTTPPTSGWYTPRMQAGNQKPVSW